MSSFLMKYHICPIWKIILIILKFFLSLNGEKNVFPIFYPITINNFINEREINLNGFKLKWKEIFSKKIRTVNFSIDELVIKSGKDFEKYFSQLVDLNFLLDYETIFKKGVYRYGLWFDITNNEFLLKIICHFPNVVLFKMKFQPGQEDLAKFFLNTLTFIFIDEKK